jgi:dynein heavy chain, axonemal
VHQIASLEVRLDSVSNCAPQVLFNEGLLSSAKLAPGFASPDPRDYNYRQYSDHLEKGLKDENPVMYGMHPNAEIGYLTSTTETIFATILRLRVGSTASRGAADSSSSALRDAIADLLSRLPRQFSMLDINDRSQEALQGVSLVLESSAEEGIQSSRGGLCQEHGPFVVVAVQECTRMNRLLEEIDRSLNELRKGLNGQLNMSQAMEDLALVRSKLRP